MHNHEHTVRTRAVTDRIAEMGGNDDESVVAAVAALRELGEHPPSDSIAAAHVAEAANAAAGVAQTRRQTVKPTTRITHAAAAVAVMFVLTAGAAYAGVLPDTINPTAVSAGAVAEDTDAALADVPATTDSEAVAAEEGADETTVDEKAAGEDGADEAPAREGTRTIPDEIAEVFEAVTAFRAAAWDWRECVRVTVGPDGGDPADCGPAPTPAEYGLTEEALVALPEKMQARVARAVEGVAAKLACIEAHLDDPEARRACFADVADDDTSRRGEQIRERQSEREVRGDRDRSDADERRAEREARRDRDPGDRADRSEDRDPRNNTEAPSQREPGERHNTDPSPGSRDV